MDQMKAMQSATNCLNDYISELEKRIEVVKGYLGEQRIAYAFVQNFPEDMPNPEDGYTFARTRVAMTLDSGTVEGLMINYDATTVNEIVEPLRWLAKLLGKYKIEDYPEMNRRSYIFSNGRFRFQVFFGNQEASVCKFVQVGVKEEPVYKLMCEKVTV